VCVCVCVCGLCLVSNYVKTIRLILRKLDTHILPLELTVFLISYNRYNNMAGSASI
jgi:hypothetical protein